MELDDVEDEWLAGALIGMTLINIYMEDGNPMRGFRHPIRVLKELKKAGHVPTELRLARHIFKPDNDGGIMLIPRGVDLHVHMYKHSDYGTGWFHMTSDKGRKHVHLDRRQMDKLMHSVCGVIKDAKEGMDVGDLNCEGCTITVYDPRVVDIERTGSRGMKAKIEINDKVVTKDELLKYDMMMGAVHDGTGSIRDLFMIKDGRIHQYGLDAIKELASKMASAFQMEVDRHDHPSSGP